ncbi:MAG TPA: methylmalonyl Co-A mutase-associated GTPase MeaB [Acidimicrobiia bacterium]|nr:methylmalonyl Co-A mutase-associated GTPase MeaB [Acidimicrobiia bacterium]
MDAAVFDLVRSGDRRALSRAITQVEQSGSSTGVAAPETVLGITGPPGAGKSTLISALIDVIRSRDETVAVLALDPSSPITGGAILGDRIRMQGHIDDEGVYIRSMATRGHLGGLAAATREAVALLGAAGFDRVIVETVGVGQSEVEIMGVADIVVLVVGPSWGDQVQADKAGIVEIADVFVVNKGDRPGVDDVKCALRETADARGVKVLVTTAMTGEGVSELLSEIDHLIVR